MNDSDQVEFSKIITILEEFYRKKLEDSHKRMYWRLLKTEITVELLADAAHKHMQNKDHGRFFPMPADLLREKSEILKNRPSNRPEHRMLPPPKPVAGPREIPDDIQAGIDKLRKSAANEKSPVKDTDTERRLAFEEKLRNENPDWRTKRIRFTPYGQKIRFYMECEG